MYKHVGKHGDKKVVVLFRQVPNEDHMTLVVYSDLLPRIYHDNVMSVLESPVGQQAENFADALFRTFMSDGINSLEALHNNHLIKKVQTNQVVMTPTPTSSIRLDELNKLLTEMAQGKDAINRMAEIDSNRGMTGKKTRAEPKELGVSPMSRSQPAVIPENNGGVLTDADLARSRLQQAETMKANAAQLLAEAERLSKEASDLDPTIKSNDKTTKSKKAAPKKT